MKVGTYSRLCAPLLGCTLLWSNAACGSRTSLLEEDASVSMDTPAQESSSSGGGRAGSGTSARGGRGGTATAGSTAGRAASGGEGGRAGREEEAGGRGGAGARDAAADSGEDGEPEDASRRDAGDARDARDAVDAGTGGEELQPDASTGAEQAGAGGESAGAGGETVEPEAGSGGSEAEPVDAGSPPAPEQLSGLTAEQTAEICGRIDSATTNLQWNEAIRGWCSRGSLGTPECPTRQETCIVNYAATLIPNCVETMPDCPDITIEEFVTCRTDTLVSFVEYNAAITCEMPPELARQPTSPSCVEPNQRCPALSMLSR